MSELFIVFCAQKQVTGYSPETPARLSCAHLTITSRKEGFPRMNALAGRGDNGMNGVRAVVVNGVMGEMLGEDKGSLGVEMGLGQGRGRVALAASATAPEQASRLMRLVEGGPMLEVCGVLEAGSEIEDQALQEAAAVQSWQSLRALIDGMQGPIDEARSLAGFRQVMQKLQQQQEQQEQKEQRWRWLRRISGALAAVVGAQAAVRMLSR